MKHRILNVGIAVVASTAIVAVARVPRPEGCVVQSIECTGIVPLETGHTWIPTDLSWTPNRLPAAMISFRTGLFCSSNGNYRGLQNWWYDQDDGAFDDGVSLDPMDELRSRITDAYDSGYRRIILNLPAGTVRGQDFPSSQWWPIPQSKREELACLILNWRADHADTQFEVYAGFAINDPSSLCMSASNAYTVPTIEAGTCGNLSTQGYMYYPCAGANTAHSPSPFVQADVCDFHRNIDPWQQLGITRYWLDGSAGYWSDFLELAYSPLYAPPSGYPHFLGAEAFPLDTSSPPEIDMARAFFSPAIIFPNNIPGLDSDKSWDVSTYAASTELMVIVDYSDDVYFKINSMFDLLAWTQRGFVLAAQSSANAFVPSDFTKYMQRVYDFGTLPDRRDFNGDGFVTSDDLSDFDAQYALYVGKSNCNWVHGDVNGDHQVTASDAVAYRFWYTYQASVHPPYPASLGTANPDNALTKP